MTGRVYVIPAVIAVLTVAGVVGAGYISVPTLTHEFDPEFDGETAEAVLIVEGVRCRGMADYLREHIEHLPGLVSMVAYAGKHRVVIEYSPRAVDVDGIIAAIEAPAKTDDGLIQYFDVILRENR